jgi:hypothetical protein
MSRRHGLEFLNNPWCSQVSASALEQCLDGEPETIIKQGKAPVVEQPSFAMAHGPGPLSQPEAVRWATLMYVRFNIEVAVQGAVAFNIVAHVGKHGAYADHDSEDGQEQRSVSYSGGCSHAKDGVSSPLSAGRYLVLFLVWPVRLRGISPRLRTACTEQPSIVRTG